MNDRIGKTIEKYNKIATQYAINIQNYHSQKDIDYLSQILKPQSKILDIGCTAGRDSRILKVCDKAFRVCYTIYYRFKSINLFKFDLVLISFKIKVPQFFLRIFSHF